MSIIIRLQNLPWTANAEDIRQFFRDLTIPEGGVHIVGGEHGDAFIVFGSDEDARLAMRKDGETIKETKIKLLLSSRVEMQKVIEVAKQQALNPQNLMQTLVGATNAAAAAAASTPAVPMSLLLQAIPALRNLTGLPAMSSLTAMPAAMPFAGVPTSTAITTATPASDPRNNVANDANKMMPIAVPKAPSIQLNAKKSDNKYGGGGGGGLSRSRSRSRSTSPLRSRDARNRGSVTDRSRDRRWKRDRSRSRNRDKRSSRSRSPVDKYRKRNRSHERRSSRTDTKYDSYSWSNDAQSSDNRRNEPASNAIMSPKQAAKKQDFDSRFANRLPANAANTTTTAAANFTNSYASQSSSTDVNGGGATKLNNQLPKNMVAQAAAWPPNVPQPPTMPWMNDKLLASGGGGIVMDSQQKALNDMMEGAAKSNVPPMGMFAFVPPGMAPPAPGMFPFGGMPQAAALPNNMPLPPMPPANFGQFPGALQPSQANMSNNVNVNEPQQPANRVKSPELDENEVDCFGRMRRKHHDRNESFSPEPSNARFDGDRPYGGARRDNRPPRDNTFKRDFAHAHGIGNYQNEDGRANYRSHDDFPRRGGGGGGHGQYRRNFDRRDSDDEKRADGGGGSNFRTGYDADRRNGFRSNNNDDRRELPPRAGYSVNNANGSTCVELRYVPCDAVEDDIKNFFAPIPLYDSCIKFAACAEDGARTRTVLIKFSNVNQRLDALKYRGRSINGCRVRVYECENDVWESTESVPPVGQLRQPYVKISFIPKRAVKEDVLSALPVQPVDFVITKARNRASLTAYLKFASIEPVEQVLSNKHKIYICEGRVKLETIDEEQFNESKKLIEQETADDEETTTTATDAPPSKQRRFEDEEQRADGGRLSAEQPPPPSRTYCVSVKNLPADVTDDDISDLFAAVHAYPSRIHMSFDLSGDGGGDDDDDDDVVKQTAEAFCEFSKESGAENALTKNGCVFRGQTITVESVPEHEVRSTSTDWSNNRRTGGGGGGGITTTRQRYGAYSTRGTFKSRGPFHKRQTTRVSDRRRDLAQAPNLESFGRPGCVVALENVPYKADVEDILELFEDYNVTRENVIRRFNDKGLPTGDARVSLESPSEALRAISELDGRKILNRNVYVKVVM